ncbi:DUF3152 domain-containing protein [Streptomyces sp. NPDC007088]|uniref:DUF3152 domain-containing protein n=1 Tax=Streptomyces sp. NPDC007088 TaxID=3364773 RepID=UPI0036AC68FD
MLSEEPGHEDAFLPFGPLDARDSRSASPEARGLRVPHAAEQPEKAERPVPREQREQREQPDRREHAPGRKEREPGRFVRDTTVPAAPRVAEKAATPPVAAARPPVREPGAGMPGPRHEYLAAFDEEPAGARGTTPPPPAVRDQGAEEGDGDGGDLFRPRVPLTREPERRSAPDAAGADAVPPAGPGAPGGPGGPHGTAASGVPRRRRLSRAGLVTGACAAAVTLGLGVVVSGQGTGSGKAKIMAGQDGSPRTKLDAKRPTPSEKPARPRRATYEELMGRTYPLAADLHASGAFTTVPGSAAAPRSGRQLLRYRVDVERGLGLDGALFADAVQKTLNDDRSWAHGQERAFERVSTARADFVVTLASPGTTADWCAKSGLDTTVDNVSCDSAATERVMINAYRWAQGSVTYGDAIHPYRQMLINHEVGHRLGHNHVSCAVDGSLAPVMQQQTKFLDHDGIHCLPNAWPFPKE